MHDLESSEYKTAQKVAAHEIQQNLNVTLIALPEFSTTA